MYAQTRLAILQQQLNPKQYSKNARSFHNLARKFQAGKHKYVQKRLLPLIEAYALRAEPLYEKPGDSKGAALAFAKQAAYIGACQVLGGCQADVEAVRLSKQAKKKIALVTALGALALASGGAMLHATFSYHAQLGDAMKMLKEALDLWEHFFLVIPLALALATAIQLGKLSALLQQRSNEIILRFGESGSIRRIGEDGANGIFPVGYRVLATIQNALILGSQQPSPQQGNPPGQIGQGQGQP